MNRLRIKHITGFHYGGDVTASYNEARMLPTRAPRPTTTDGFCRVWLCQARRW